MKLFVALASIGVVMGQGTGGRKRPSSKRPSNKPSKANNEYAAPAYAAPASGGYGAPPATEAPYAPPVTTQAPYNPPETQAPYNPPQTQAPYNPPETQAPYNPPETQAPYNPPETEAPSSYNPPSNQYSGGNQESQYSSSGNYNQPEDGGYGDYEAGGQGYGYGDPHFMVQTQGQDALCFDYNPTAGSEMTLIMDPTSNLLITADIEGRRKGKTVFMTKVHFNSPMGAKLSISSGGVETSGLPAFVGDAPEDGENGMEIYGDILFKEHLSEDGSRDKIVVTIMGGPSFLVKEKVLRETLSFGVTDVSGISQKSRGVIGQFVKPNAYSIDRHEENPELATVNANGIYVIAKQENFHHNHQCWTLDSDDILPVFSQI